MTTAIEKAERELEAITWLLWRVHDRDGAIQATSDEWPIGIRPQLEQLAVDIVIDSTRDWYAFPHGKTTVLRVKRLRVELTSDTIPAWQIEVSQKRHREATVVDVHLWGKSSETQGQLASIAELLILLMAEDRDAGKALIAGLQRAGSRTERQLMAMLDMQLHRATSPVAELAQQAPQAAQLGFGNGGAS